MLDADREIMRRGGGGGGGGGGGHGDPEIRGVRAHPLYPPLIFMFHSVRCQLPLFEI